MKTIHIQTSCNLLHLIYLTKNSTFSYLFSSNQEDFMLITTTPALEGKSVTNYYGLVSGEAILGANIFKDIFAHIRDIVGGRAGAYEKELREAKEIAIQEMVERAKALGANAVIGVDLDYETIGISSGNMLMVSASGTAVTVA
jgi:uncharacterized protein YbjQ (UPF0145 family)